MLLYPDQECRRFQVGIDTPSTSLKSSRKFVISKPLSIKVAIEDFNRTIDFWIRQLEQYTLAQLCIKPSPTRWSLGQLYRHLIDDARYYIGQIKICVASNQHSNEEASSAAKEMLRNNTFPDEVIMGAPSNAHIPQPENKGHLMNDLVSLKAEMEDAACLISDSPFCGKTKHPGFHYFSAKEWLQFADMHFRHHLRQKKRIDNFLKIYP